MTQTRTSQTKTKWSLPAKELGDVTITVKVDHPTVLQREDIDQAIEEAAGALENKIQEIAFGIQPPLGGQDEDGDDVDVRPVRQYHDNGSLKLTDSGNTLTDGEFGQA